MAELPAGQVTVADLYREMVEVRNQIGNLVTGFTLAEERHKNDQEVHRDHERRIRGLERGWWKISGAAAAISVIVSLLTALLTLRVR